MKYVPRFPLLPLLCTLLCFNCLTQDKETNRIPTGYASDDPGFAPPTIKKSIAQTLQGRPDLSIDEQIALYRRLRKEDPMGYNFDNEDEMTMYGYRLLWNDEPDKALQIFKLIVEVFPESSNPYDSLGEAYLVLGDSLRALKNYNISLKINPENFNAEDQIARIQNPGIKFPSLSEKFRMQYGAAAYREDLVELGEKLLKYHPHALKFTTLEEFQRTLNAKQRLIDETTTFAEFAWHCSELIALIKCSHTGMGSFFLESEMLPPDRRFPLRVRLIENELYLTKDAPEAGIITKDRIVAINGESVPDLVQDVFRHMQSQGNVSTSKVHSFNRWSSVLIPYALDFPEHFEIQIASHPKPIAISASASAGAPTMDAPYTTCMKDFCLDWLDAKKTAVLTLPSFNFYPWNNLDLFEEFLDSSFAQIRENTTEKLIIDLRGNGGGSPQAGVYLLRHLTEKPFVYFPQADNDTQTVQPIENRFGGKVLFLIDGDGKSTTGHVMALVKEHKLGIIVGEELGSNHFCTAGQTLLRLKNTRLEFYVANTASSVLVKSLPDDRGILPDFAINQDIDDYLNGIDTVLKYAMELVP
ncbi:S41 family peptidase [Robiginitalea sediminis]|uniref:S41 family peptidase n=1 Tax=Robiginitalea sediminis TaxID=1982593 RepID=UPI000B4B5CAD|nr:S41 family peptidase [Robiginitalea sediminis]